MICRLLLIGALSWALALSSPVAVQKAEYHPMLESFAPDPDPNIVRFPHEISCHHFYHQLSEEDIVIQKCPDDELFDYLKHRCVEKDSARCWNRLIKDINHESVHIHYQKNRDKFQCPHPYGHFPNVTDCNHYYKCLSGKPKSKKCAPFELFDKIKRKCMAEIKAICADHTDVIEPDYKCPRSWGSFSFSKDCSKYYECVEKSPDLRTCKNHMLFDEKKMKCMPQKTTDCGSRHNPYHHHHTTEATRDETSPRIETKVPKTPIKPDTDASIVTGRDDQTKGKGQLPTEFGSSENELSKESVEKSQEKPSSKESQEESGEDSKENSIEIVMLEKKKKTSEPLVKEEFTTAEKVTPEKSQKESILEDSKKNSIEIVMMEKKEKTSEPLVKEEITTAEKVTPEKSQKESILEDSKKNSIVEVDEEKNEKNDEPLVRKEFTTAEKVTPEKISSETTVRTKEIVTESIPTLQQKKECHSGDPSCILDKDGEILRCRSPNGFFAHPKYLHLYLYCSKNRIYVKRCPSTLVFIESKQACTWDIDQFKNYLE